MGSTRHPRLLPAARYACFDGVRPPKTLTQLCLALLREQIEAWPACREGYAGLSRVREREVACSRFSVRLQHNPGRMRSTLAEVGEKAIQERPCFLCPDNLPKGQKTILYREDYLILCNPMPVFSAHFTIPHLIHRPQAVGEAAPTLLRLAADLGPAFAILYNGPECGASAPDHLHFQAVPAGQMPIEGEIRPKERRVFVKRIDGVSIERARDVGREVVILNGASPAAVEGVFQRLLDAFRDVLLSEREPMLNLICAGQEQGYVLLVFPRAKHRPDAFFRTGDGRVAISPAAVEMGGVVVAPREKDFERLDAPLVEEIFREVTLDAETVAEVMDALT